MHDAVSAGGAVAKDVLVPEVEVQLSGSSTTPARFVDAEPAPKSMPPPAKRAIVVGFPAPSPTPAVVSKSRKRPSANPDAANKRKCAEAGPLPIKASGLGSASRHRAKVCFEQKLLPFLMRASCRGSPIPLTPWRPFTLGIWPWQESRRGGERGW
ncbi:hypothetical protein Bca52824_065208 [Brassica carinata]|uniref:Uncharacterized protein n=1 Tax=Brassica carinata TaxID=52824 RepID=A0A8X7QJ04_BRACI|nr:hypothetical protein Bca52824_065208 [Brassica carinata]